MKTIYDLHNSSDKGKGRIKASMNPLLKSAILKLDKPTKISRFLNIPYSRLWELLNRSAKFPLIYLKKLELKYKTQLAKYVDYLEYGTGQSKRKAKAVRAVTEDLAKIFGAHAADGHLKERKTTRAGREITHYELVLRESFKSNVEAFCKWFNNIFDINIKPRHTANHWFIYISNKVIFRYFKNIFEFTAGRKTETVRMPKMLYCTPLKIKKAFITGVLMFDGSVNYRNGYIELYSKSKDLIKDVARVLKSLEIVPDYLSLKPDKYQRFRLVIRKKEKLKISIELFEPYTEKWQRLKDQIYGFNTKAKSISSLIKDLDLLYPRIRPTAITFSDVINSINNLEQIGRLPDFRNISKVLKRHSTVVYEYLKKLEDWKILVSKRYKNKKVWKLNKKWR